MGKMSSPDICMEMVRSAIEPVLGHATGGYRQKQIGHFRTSHLFSFIPSMPQPRIPELASAADV